MATTEYLSIANSNTSTPSRRTSWKTEQDSDASSEDTICEKSSPYSTSTSDHNHTAPLQTSNATNKPNAYFAFALFTCRLDHTIDIEAQHGLDHQNKVSWKQRVAAYIILTAVIFVWVLLIVGVLILTDNLFPSALRSYHMLKDMGAELANTKFEIEGLKAQVATLYEGVRRWDLFQKVGV